MKQSACSAVICQLVGRKQKHDIKYFQKCIAFRPSVLGMRTRSLEGVIMLHIIGPLSGRVAHA